MQNKSSYKPNTKQMALIGLMTALLCLLGPLSLVIPISPVPLSLCPLGIYFVVLILGLGGGTLSVLLYLLLGLVGLPIFSGFSGGAGKLLGPTGGYLIGYLFLALILGACVRTAYRTQDGDTKKHTRMLPLRVLAGMLLGTLVLYLFGTAWLALQAGLSFQAALFAGVIPFIPGDLLKMLCALAVGLPLRKRLAAANLI